jgi:hypothetical protein
MLPYWDIVEVRVVPKIVFVTGYIEPVIRHNVLFSSEV